MSDRDPDTIYGPMGAEVPKGYKPGGPEPRLLEPVGVRSSQVHRTNVHGPRILKLTLHNAGTWGPGLSITEELKFNDLCSPTQAKAIMDCLEELNWRLSAALNALIDPDAR